MLVSFKQSKQSIGLLMMQNLNNDQRQPHPNEKYQMGDEVDITVLDVTETGFILTVP